jgi:hypothetical protein
MPLYLVTRKRAGMWLKWGHLGAFLRSDTGITGIDPVGSGVYTVIVLVSQENLLKHEEMRQRRM